jgi:hypothetical protein
MTEIPPKVVLRRTFRTEELSEAEVKAITESRMDPRHDYLNDELLGDASRQVLSLDDLTAEDIAALEAAGALEATKAFDHALANVPPAPNR